MTFDGRHRLGLLASALAVGLALIIVPASPAFAVTATWVFSGTVDTSPIGGGAGTPTSFVFTFDTDLSPDSGYLLSAPPSLASYGPVSAVITVGADTVNFTNGMIGIANTSTVDAFGIQGDAPSSSFTGTILGLTPWNASFYVYDDIFPITMLGSTALPLDTSFVTLASRAVVAFNFDESSFFTTLTPGEFTLSAVPLPAALPLLVGGIGALGLTAWRKKRAVAASPH